MHRYCHPKEFILIIYFDYFVFFWVESVFHVCGFFILYNYCLFLLLGFIRKNLDSLFLLLTDFNMHRCCHPSAFTLFILLFYSYVFCFPLSGKSFKWRVICFIYGFFYYIPFFIGYCIFICVFPFNKNICWRHVQLESGLLKRKIQVKIQQPI